MPGIQRDQTLQPQATNLELVQAFVKRTLSYSALAVLVTGVGSATILMSSEENAKTQKKADFFGKVYTACEMILAISAIAFITLKIGPVVLKQLNRYVKV